jgi:MFS family permease
MPRLNQKLLHQLSSLLEDEDADAGEGSIIHSVVPSPHISKHSSRFHKHDTTAADEKLIQNRPWISFIIIYTMIFFNGCCFTAVVPSVPFYLRVLSAPPSFLGWVVSFYSLGQIFGSPMGGFFADKVSSRMLLTMSSMLGLFSSAFYALAPHYMFVLLARWLTGVSAGMEFSVELAFIARNTTKKERTVYLASVTAVNVVGFIIGPALAGLLATLDLTIGSLNIDACTGPGWLLALMFLVDIMMVQCLFKDSAQDDEAKENKDKETNGEPNEETGLLEKEEEASVCYKSPKGESLQVENDAELNKMIQSLRDSQRPPPIKMVLGLIFVQFTVMSAWSVLETITSPLANDHFDWNVQQCNLLFTGGGVVSLMAYVIFVVASKWVKDRVLIVFALLVCFTGQMLAVDWQELTWVPGWFSALLPSYRNRFLLGYALMNGGFMTGRPVTFALFSKLIGSQYQGRYLSWMVAGGSLARMLGPFAAVAVYYGIQTVGGNLLALFGSVGLFHMACLGLIIIQWKRLLPKPSAMSVRLMRDKAKKGRSMYSQESTSFNEGDNDIPKKRVQSLR